MNKSLLFKNIKDLHNKTNNAANYVDIDYDVKRPENDPWTTKTRSTICRNDYAILNAYRLWLQSGRYDYIRSPIFGGLFENNLNDRVQFGVAAEDTVRSIIIEESAQKWPDIIVVNCEVRALVPQRQWWIKITIQDRNTKLIITDNEIRVEVGGADYQS